MATQMGVARLQPVIMDRVNEHHTNWPRLKKIIIEAAEQSGRNSVPRLCVPFTFNGFLQEAEPGKLFFADERFAHDASAPLIPRTVQEDAIILIGPEGGFSDKEFDALDKSGATGMGLGKTILRAETAAVVAIAKLTDNN